MNEDGRDGGPSRLAEILKIMERQKPSGKNE